MRKRLLLLIGLTGTLFAGETYNFKNLITGEFNFKTKAEMIVYSPIRAKDNSIQSAKIPVEITSSNEKVKKNKENGYTFVNKANIRIIAPNGQKIDTLTKVTLITDKDYRTLSLTEETNTAGQKIVINCKNNGDLAKIDKNPFIKEIGYISEKDNLICDDKSNRSAIFRIEKGEKNGTANLVFLREMKFGKDTIKDKTIVNINKDGHMNKIETEIIAKNKFEIKFTSKNINQ